MARFVIAAYRPKPGKERELRRIIRDHMPILREEGLVTDRPPLVLEAAGGVLLEIFEWASEQAMSQAHHNRTVQDLWARFEEVCDYASLAELEEARRPFAHFKPASV